MRETRSRALVTDSQQSCQRSIIDQRMALAWVKENIKAFGGDPDQVLLFGESNGAAGVSVQTLSPGSFGLFRTAVMESWPTFSSSEPPAVAVFDSQNILSIPATPPRGAVCESLWNGQPYTKEPVPNTGLPCVGTKLDVPCQ